MPTPFAALKPAMPCRPLSDAATYTLCVVDQAGKPLLGATVTASRTVWSEGFGDVAFHEEDLGTQLTDAQGRASFDLAPIESGFMSSNHEHTRTATATINGWPAQEVGKNGVIKLRPPRTARRN